MSDAALREVIDRIAIREVVERYCDAVTRRDWQQLGQCYAEDGVWRELPPTAVHEKGREAIVARASAMIEQSKSMVMLINSCVIDFTGPDSATSRTILHILGRTLDDSGTIGMLGIYEDELVRREGRWWFLNRLFSPIQWEVPAAFKEGIGA